MDDMLREELATLGQQIEVADYERRLALEKVAELVGQHGTELDLDSFCELTTLSPPDLVAMRAGD